MALNRQAIAIFKTDPVVGVGFDNYSKTIKERPEIDALSTEDILVRNVVLYALATTGVIGTTALVVLGMAVALRVLRGRSWSIGILSVVFTILMLSPQLFTDVGFMWLGVLIGLCTLFVTPSEQVGALSGAAAHRSA